jgi:hypothetical protein
MHRATVHGILVVDHDGEARSEADERGHHPTCAAQQQRPPADAVQQERGHQDEERLAGAHGAGGAQELVVAGDACALEHARAVKDDAVAARCLLEEVDAERREQYASHGGGRGYDEFLPDTRLLAVSIRRGHGHHVSVKVPRDARRRLDVR